MHRKKLPWQPWRLLRAGPWPLKSREKCSSMTPPRVHGSMPWWMDCRNTDPAAETSAPSAPTASTSMSLAPAPWAIPITPSRRREDTGTRTTNPMAIMPAISRCCFPTQELPGCTSSPTASGSGKSLAEPLSSTKTPMTTAPSLPGIPDGAGLRRDPPFHGRAGGPARIISFHWHLRHTDRQDAPAPGAPLHCPSEYSADAPWTAPYRLSMLNQQPAHCWSLPATGPRRKYRDRAAPGRWTGLVLYT